MTHARPIGVFVGLVAMLLFAASAILPPAYAKAPEFLSSTAVLVYDGFDTQAAWTLGPITLPPQNDGLGGFTGTVVDTVMPTMGPGTPLPTTTTPTPTLSPVPTGVTPWPTGLPQDCRNLIVNGGFEWSGAWTLGPTSLMPYYTGAPNPVHSGARSMAMGITPSNSPNVASYSSAQQTVTIPAFAQTAQLRFWYYPVSNAAAGGLSRQEAILLDPWAFEETIAVLWRVTENTNAWTLNVIDLTPYRGRTVSVYFNARNAGNGTRTSMYLDDVEVLACGGYAPFVDTLPDAFFEVTPVAIAPLTPIFPLVKAAVSASSTRIPQETVISVGTRPASVFVPTTTPTSGWKEPTRSERPSFLSNFKLSLTPAALAAIIFLIVLGAVLVAVYLANRRDQVKDKNP